MNKYTIFSDGSFYVFKNIDEENNKMFIERCYFIVKNIGVENIMELSRLWISVKYLGVEYEKEIMNILSTMKNIY